MYSTPVLQIQDLLYLIILFAILCCVIVIYVTLIREPGVFVNTQQPVRRRYRQRRINRIHARRNQQNHNRYPVEHDERQGTFVS